MNANDQKLESKIFEIFVSIQKKHIMNTAWSAICACNLSYICEYNVKRRKS